MDDIRLTEDFPKEPGANQIIEGSDRIICSLQEEDGGLLEAASEFAGEHFEEIGREDALDAAGELLNFISGSYAEEMSKRGTVCELHPPKYGVVPESYDAEHICRMDIRAGKKRLCFTVGLLRH